jgi:hypothetical protein
MKTDLSNEWYDALIAAKARSRLNGLGYAFAVQWPAGHCTVEDRKPSLRSQQMRVIECTSDGREVLA